MAAVDIFNEGLLMAPVSTIPRLLARHGLKFNNIDIADHRDPFVSGVGHWSRKSGGHNCLDCIYTLIRLVSLAAILPRGREG